MNLLQFEKTSDVSRINYIFNRSDDSVNHAFSLDPYHSDALENQTILNNLVGTLVKYSISGRIEPYLASRWDQSKDGRKWTFSLRDDLRCENGSPITASTFVDQLKRQLQKYSKMGKIMAFDQLKGWSRFKVNPEDGDVGIYTQGNRVIFEFDLAPKEFLEILRMSYFGFWCDCNFERGEFRKDGLFCSSGSYVLKENQNGSRIVIAKKDNWFSISDDSVSEIEFSSRHLKGAIGSYTKTMIRMGSSVPDLDDIDSYFSVRTTPTILTAFILSPWSSSKFFSKVQNRKVFNWRLKKVAESRDLTKMGIYRADSFYPTAPSHIALSQPNENRFNYSGEELEITLPNRLGPKLAEYVRDILLKVFSDIPIERIHFHSAHHGDPKIMDKYVSNRFFDIRISSVDIGGTVLNPAIEMMFCTSLGISFPDPSGRICHLVDEFKKSGKEIDSFYIREFNQILADELHVIPLFHSGLTWLYTKDFDPKTIPTGTAHPKFEEFRFVED